MRIRKMSFMSPVALDKDLCTKCNIDYYQIENDPLNLGEYFNCYKEPKGYYLDNSTLLYKNVILHVKHVKQKEII